MVLKLYVLSKNKLVASGQECPYDSVIMAVGSKANDTSMYADLGIPTYIIGDCKKAGVALDTFKDAYHAVLEINK
jgi:NADH dehydrogenase FAD-containing subunit